MLETEDLTWGDLLEWQEYDDREPFGEERADVRSAQIVQAIYALAGKNYPLADVLLYFGDAERPKPVEQPKQTLEYQEMLIDAWCSTQNAIVARQGSR